MRTASTLILLLVAGCGSTPTLTPATEPIWLTAVEPAPAPYAVPRTPKGAKLVKRVVPRVPGWTDAMHLRASDRFVTWERQRSRDPGSVVMIDGIGRSLPSDLIAFTKRGLQLTGTPMQVSTLARFFRDRTAFAGANGQIFMETWFVAVDRDRLPRFARLRPLRSGLAYAVLPSGSLPDDKQALGKVTQSPSLFVLDGQDATIFVGEVFPVVRMGEARMTMNEGPHAGFSVWTCSALSRKGTRLTVDLRGEVSAVVARTATHAGARLAIPVQPKAGGEVTERVVLPRIRRLWLKGRFTLRAGEVVCLVQDNPHGEQALLLLLSWQRAVPRKRR